MYNYHFNLIKNNYQIMMMSYRFTWNDDRISGAYIDLGHDTVLLMPFCEHRIGHLK